MILILNHIFTESAKLEKEALKRGHGHCDMSMSSQNIDTCGVMCRKGVEDYLDNNS